MEVKPFLAQWNQRARGFEYQDVMTTQQDGNVKPNKAPVFRETVESFGVALILAFLFRAFVAEAFVIPTGSMAPTLMGAHKDVTCPECGFAYQCGASQEFNSRTGQLSDTVIVGTTCPLCRYQTPLDLKGNGNHVTFSGDRILVSKFAYLFREPKRWEVIVFKYPLEAHQNYIKRLVGQPNEKLVIRHGDVYTQPIDGSKPLEIARKPPNIINAVSQPVYDSNYLAKKLIEAGLPSPFQPWASEGASTWKVDYSPQAWSASCDASNSNEPQWIRYYHQVIDPQNWSIVKQSGKFPASISSHEGRLISDFTHYNAAISRMAGSVYVHEELPNRTYRRTKKFTKGYASGDPSVFNGATAENTNFANDGVHWVGDLACEYEVEVQSKQGTLVLDLVEYGIHHRVDIDVATGKAKIQLLQNGKACDAIEDGKGGFVAEATCSTNLRGPGKYRLKLANFDEQLTLWVGGKPQVIQPSGSIAMDRVVKVYERYPRWTPTDPLDAAPAGLGISNGKVAVQRAKVWRDLYYISSAYGRYRDYEEKRNVISSSSDAFEQYTTDKDRQEYLQKHFAGLHSNPDKLALARDTLFSNPSLWKEDSLFAARRTTEYQLNKDQYFPMGDNSPQSYDARGWDIKYVPEPLMIGRAISVFWPHYWNRPIPFTPNVRRMGLIR